MKRLLLLVLILSMLAFENIFVFASDISEQINELQIAENTYRAVAARYPDLFTGSVDGNDNVIASETEISGFPVIKAVAVPESESSNSIVSLDNYNISVKGNGITLENYKYITVIYKYEGNVPQGIVPAVYIAASTNGLSKGPVGKHIETKTFVGGWKASLFEIPDPSELYINPDIEHYLRHFHLRPFGSSYKAHSLSDDATIYVQGVVFHPEKDIDIEVFSPYINGNDDGTFRPNENLTRAQTCKIICKVLGAENAEFYDGETSFDDVEKELRYYGYVTYCEKLGLLGAFGKSFEPDKYIKTDEFFAMLQRTVMTIPNFAKLPSGAGTLNFSDTGYITRAQAVAFINNTLISNVKIDDATVKAPFSDVNDSVWAYNDILIASTPMALIKAPEETSYRSMYPYDIPDVLDESVYELGEEKLREAEELEIRRIYEIRNHQSTLNVTGTIYYFSEFGNDSNNGLSPDNPKKTLEALENIYLKAGDAVLFKRGETFRGSIKAVSGVTYSSYGDYGDKPVLMASPQNFADEKNWVETDTPNVWKLTTPITNDVGLVVFNDGEAWTEKRIKGRPDFVNGDLAELDKDLTMWHDVLAPTDVSGYVYVRSDKGNPGKRFKSIEVSPRVHIIRAADNIVIDNLCFKYTGGHAVSAGTINNLTVKNCEFAFIGGSWFRTDTLSRFGNAVEVYGGCDGYVVDNCYITQCYDAGVTHQLSDSPDTECIMKNIKYTNNVITDTSYPIEYFINQPNEGVEHKIVNFEISGNIIMRTGMGFGDQRPDKTAATAIKGWNTYNEAYNYTITNNIFAVSKYFMMAVGAKTKEWAPVCDNNTYIQYHNGRFGTMLVGTNSIYDSGVKEFIIETSGDKNAQVYYLRPLAEEDVG